MDHDRLFKELLTTFFAEFVELFLPDVSAYLQPGTLEFLDKEVFTDITSGEKHEADLVVKARFQQQQEAFFLIHVENQSTPQAQFGRRMFRYFARLHDKFGLPVYPVVIFSYDAPQRAEPKQYRVRFPQFRVLDFRYRVIQLNRLSWRRFVQQPNPVASALMAKMRIAPRDRPRVKLECLRLLATLRLNPAKMQLISGFVDSYLPLSALEQRAFDQAITALAPQEQEATMEIVTSWMKEGIAKGEQLGSRREALLLVSRLLRHRFGALPDELQQQIEGLSTLQLEELAEALLDFSSLSDAQAWTTRHA